MRVSTKENLNGLAAWLVAAGLVGRRVRIDDDDLKLLGSGKAEEEIRPRFKKATDGHFFDVNSNSAEEVAKVYKEERRTNKPVERVTSSSPVGRNDVDFSEYNVHAMAEWEATQRSFDLAEQNYNLIFWISAEDGAMGLSPEEAKEKGCVYSDGRLNIYFKSVDANGNVALKGKHLPLSINRFLSFELGKRLVEMGGITLGKMEDVEDLRVQPIGFRLDNLDDWIKKCREMMPEMGEFWDTIEKGDDVRHQEEMEKVVSEVMRRSGGDNRWFQMEMMRRGFEINTSGNHGMGYLDNGVGGLVLNFKIERIGGMFFTEPKIDSRGNLVCPVCGAKVANDDVKCRECGIGLKK